MLFLNVLCKWNLMSEIIWEEKGFTSSLPVHHSYILFTPTRFVETYEIYVALNASGKGRNLFSPIPPPSEEVGQNLWPRRGAKLQCNSSAPSSCQVFLLLLFPYLVLSPNPLSLWFHVPPIFDFTSGCGGRGSAAAHRRPESSFDCQQQGFLSLPASVFGSNSIKLAG